MHSLLLLLVHRFFVLNREEHMEIKTHNNVQPVRRNAADINTSPHAIALVSAWRPSTVTPTTQDMIS